MIRPKAILSVSQKVDGVEITISANANEQGHLYGSITEQEIAEHLQKEGHAVSSSQVVMEEHFRMLGSFAVKLKFTDDVASEIKVWVVRPEGQAVESQPEQVPEADE